MEADAESDPLVQSAITVMAAPDFQSWVQANRWNYYPAVALVFTDMVGSTTLLYEGGDDAYGAVLADHLNQARDLISVYHGREINTTGDGVLCAFLKAGDAVRFALNLFKSSGSDQVQIRAGIHFGNVKFRSQDFCGKNVHCASRVMSQAVGAEIWRSDDARERLEEEGPEFLSQLGLVEQPNCALKNVPGQHRLWRLCGVEAVNAK